MEERLGHLDRLRYNVRGMDKKLKKKERGKSATCQQRPSPSPSLPRPQAEEAEADCLAFISGYPGHAVTAKDSLNRLFAGATQTDANLSHLCMEGGSFPDWARAEENREKNTRVAMQGIEDASTLIVDRLLQLASESPSSEAGQWAGRFLAEVVNQLIAESPGLHVGWKEDRITPATALASNLAFVNRLRKLRKRGTGKKVIKSRGADASRLVLKVWDEVLEEWARLLIKAGLSPEEASFLCLPTVDERRIVKVLGAAESALRAGRGDRADIARKVFSDLLAGVLESRWKKDCLEYPDLAANAEGGANRRGMMSSFAVKRDNFRQAWLSIAQSEGGLSRLLA